MIIITVKRETAIDDNDSRDNGDNDDYHSDDEENRNV
jgi:hypothetical protein